MEKQQIANRLENISLPISSIKVDTQLLGCFCPPQEWKTTDELNPNLFTYTARFMMQQFTFGKIQARQLTEKEIRQQQDNTKKKGAPGKKETKDPAQQQRLKRIRQEEAEAQTKRYQQEAKLTEEERFWTVSEDPQRAFSLKFETKSSNAILQGKHLIIFEERVFKDKGEWIYIYKHPSVSEDQIAKLRKAKSKNLNLNDLNLVVMRAWVDLSQLQVANTTEVTLRCRLHQVEETAETSRPNLQKTYIAFKIKLSESLNKQTIAEEAIQSSDLIAPIPPKSQLPADVQSVNSLKQQIKVILESIAMEFGEANWKQLNAISQQKSSQPLFVTKQTDKVKRMELFLYEFNVKGMYKVMKERVKKVIVKICKNKFKDQLKQYASFTGVSTQAKDQFYSEIYGFLIEQYQEVLKQIIQQKKEELYLTPVESIKVYKNDIDNYIKQRINENESQRIVRLTKQYESLRNLDAAQEIYLEAMKNKGYGQGLDIKFQYVKFCLRNNVTSSPKIIKIVYEVLQGKKQNPQLQTILLYDLLLFSSKKKIQCKKGWIFLRELIANNPNSVQYLLIAKLAFQNFLVDEKLAQKYYCLAQRLVLRKIGALQPLGQHQSNPSLSQLPSLKNGCQYNIQLESDQVDSQLYLPLVNLLLKYNLFDLLELVLPKISNQQNLQVVYASILSQQNKNTQKALESALSFNQKSPNFLLTKLITRISYQSGNVEMCEQYLKRLFRYKQTIGDFSTYLQLASVYYKKGELGNSKACLVKLLQFDNNNSIAWLTLGNVQFKLGNIDNAIRCLREANVLNPTNHQIWYSLCEIYLKQGKMNIANTCLVNSMKLRKRKQFGFGDSLTLFLTTSKFQSKNDQEISELMLTNIRSVQQAQ